MKIFSINIAEKKNNNMQIKNNLQYCGLKIGKYSTFSKLNTINSDIVSFGKKNTNKVPLVGDGDSLAYHKVYNDLKNIPNLPCVYCGEPMLSVPNRKRIIRELSTMTGQDLIDVINKNKNFIRGHKLNVAENVVLMAQNYPNDNILEVFEKLAPKYRAELEKEQTEVINKINVLYGNSFTTDEEKKLFQSLLYETNQWINSQDEDEPFKRKAFLGELKRIFSLPIFKKNQSLTKKIYAEAEKLPQSFENENAFVIKYHRRSAREIAELMLYEAMSTIEHIKPQEVGGATIPNNLAIACAKCNNYERNNKPLDKFISEHPEVHKNVRKNFDAILRYSEKQSKFLYKKLSENANENDNYQRYMQSVKDNEIYRKYIEAIAKTYMMESKGILDLNKYIVGEK